jgi:hypothetical protein
VDKKLPDVGLLVEELKDETRATIYDGKLKELTASFSASIRSSEKPSTDGMERLPGWFLIHALGSSWPDIKDKQFLVCALNSKLSDANQRDMKIELAARISTIDPPSGVSLLAAMDNKKLRKKGELPKNYVESLIRYFINGDAQPIYAILNYKFDKHHCLCLVATQLFEALFGGKTPVRVTNKYELQAKLLNWLIVHEQYMTCSNILPNNVAKEISQWPIAMLEDLENIQEKADTAGIQTSIYNTFTLKLQPEEASNKDNFKNTLSQKNLDADRLLLQLGNIISNYKKNIDMHLSEIVTLRKIITELQNKNDSISKNCALLTEKKEDLVGINSELYSKIQEMEKQRSIEIKNHDIEITRQKTQVANKDKELIELNIKIESEKKAHSADISLLSNRMAVESEHSRNVLAEKIHDMLTEDFNDMNRLDDTEKHRAAKIMLGHIFSKLHNVGINF